MPELIPTPDLNDLVRQAEAMALQLPQVDLQTQHLVFGKVSARAIRIPADTFLTGALTCCNNVCIVFGDIEVTTDDGPLRLTGFNMLPANAGAKRAGRTFSETWWVTVHHTELTDLAEVEREMTPEAHLLQTNRAGIEFATPGTLEG